MLICTALILGSACQKEKLTETSTTSPKVEAVLAASAREDLNTFALTTNEVQYVNGLLKFSSKSVFDQVLTSLNALKSDQQFASLVSQNQVGNNENPVDEPVLKLFESRFPGYASLRMNEEARFESYSQTDSNSDFVPHGFISDNVYQTILSGGNEFQIGDAIVKYIGRDEMLVIDNGDLNLLATIRQDAHREQSLVYEHLHYINENHVNDRNFVKKLLDPELNVPCDVKIGVHSFEDESLPRFTLLIFNKNASAAPKFTKYDYKIVAANGATVLEVLNFPEPKYETDYIGANNQFPYPWTISIKMKNPKEENCEDTDFLTINQNLDACCDFNIITEISKDTPKKFKFKAEFNVFHGETCGLSGGFNWDFDGDGIFEVQNGGQVIEHEFTNAGNGAAPTVTCEYVGTTGFPCHNIEKVQVNISCGLPDRESRINNQLFANNSNKRATLVLWCNDYLFYSSTGAWMKTQRKTWLGTWTYTNVGNLLLTFTTNARYHVEVCESTKYYYNKNLQFTHEVEERQEQEAGSQLRVLTGQGIGCNFKVIDGGITAIDKTLYF